MIDVKNELDNILILDQPKEFYRSWHDKIINNAKTVHPGIDKFKYPGEFLEVHHILPKSLGGTNDEKNLVILTTLEHIIIHILLYLLNTETENEKIYGYACWCMITKYGDYTKSRTSAKQYIDPLILSEIRNNYISSVSKAVVGFDEDFNVVRIYSKQEDCREDGFNPSGICEAIKGTYKRAGGYNWDVLSNFSIKHKDKIDEYFEKLDLGEVPDLGDINERSKYFAAKEGSASQPNLCPVVCCDKEFNIIREYKSISEVSKDGFSYKHVPSVLRRERGRKTHGGYLWFKTEDFKYQYPNKYKTFQELKSLPELTSVSKKEFRKIVMSDLENNVLKLYTSAQELSKEHTMECVLKSIYGNYGNCGSGYKGYKWYYLEEFERLFPDKIKEYYEKGNTNTNNT